MTDAPRNPSPRPSSARGVGEEGPVLTLKERDRRWAGLRALMRQRGIAAILVGSFQGRERLESYLIDDFLDSIVMFPLHGEPTVLAFASGRVSRLYESARRGIEPWVTDIRIGFGGAKAAEVLAEKQLASATIGLVGLGPTAPGEMEGVLPLGLYKSFAAALPNANIVDFTQAFTDFLLVKSPEELALLRYAARVSEEACQAMLDIARPGVSETEVYAEILRAIHRRGCEVRYPGLSLQSGPDNIAWGVPRWTLRAEPARVLVHGDVVQAEIHTMYGAQEVPVQMSVALDPIDPELKICEDVARLSYEAGLAAVRPGVTFADVVQAMEGPLRESGCWAKTPLLHTLTFGATGFTRLNRDQLDGTPEGEIEAEAAVGIRRGELVLVPGMGLELEPNACLGTRRVNIGGVVIVTRTGAEALNELPTRVRHVK